MFSAIANAYGDDIGRREAKRILDEARKARALPTEIDFDTWAESGGTAGIFAKGVRSGKIKIVDLD